MDEPNLDNPIYTQRLLMLQIIAGALIFGVLAFLVLVVFIVQNDAANQPEAAVVSLLALGALPLSVALWTFIPGLVSRKGVEQIADGTWRPGPDAAAGSFPDDTSKLWAVYQTRIIIASALLEGAAFIGCTAYLVEHQIFVLAVPVIVLALMVATFPTRGRVGSWVEEQLLVIQGRR
jgi:hypothetical protein